ncbi:MAG: hypothetical protein NZ843_01185 [Fimbriimonadales bacterium]|nr:hypothetical protein [Fimbriimonadales bacterium]
MKRFLLVGVGLLLVGAFFYSWYRAMQSPYRQVIRLADGSSVRLLQITVGKQHALRPPQFAGVQRWLGVAQPPRAAQLPFTFAEPRVVLWLEHRFAPPPAHGGIGGGVRFGLVMLRSLRINIRDAQGNSIRVDSQFVDLDADSCLLAVILPPLSDTVRTVELQIIDPPGDRPLRIALPRISASRSSSTP